MADDLDALEKLAKAALAAAPEPWDLTVDVHGNVTLTDADEGIAYLGSVGKDGLVGNVGLFIAAANPSAILALVRRVRAAEAERRSVLGIMDAVRTNGATLSNEEILAQMDIQRVDEWPNALTPCHGHAAQQERDEGGICPACHGSGDGGVVSVGDRDFSSMCSACGGTGGA